MEAVPGEDSLIIRKDLLLKSLGNRNTLAYNQFVEILKFGFRIKQHYFHFGINQRFDIGMNIDKNLAVFALSGNASPEFFGKDLVIDRMNVYANLYHEAYIGYNIKLFDKLTLGVRAKYLRGVGNLSTKKFIVNFKTDSTNYHIHMSSDIEFQHSLDYDQLTADYNQFSNPKELLNLGHNSGFALDIGANLDIQEKLRLSLSVVDLGSIKWNSEAYLTHTINPGKEFEFGGLNFTDTTSIASESIIDSITGSFELVTELKPYTTVLTPKIYFGGRYKITDYSQVGFLFRSSITNFDKIAINSYSATANYRHTILRGLDLQVNYSVINNTYNNVGLGFSFRLGPVMLYGITDNVIAFYDPTKYENYNAILGMSFLFSRKKKNPEERDEDF